MTKIEMNSRYRHSPLMIKLVQRQLKLPRRAPAQDFIPIITFVCLPPMNYIQLYHRSTSVREFMSHMYGSLTISDQQCNDPPRLGDYCIMMKVKTYEFKIVLLCSFFVSHPARKLLTSLLRPPR